MEEYKDHEEDDILSLSNLPIDDGAPDSQEVTTTFYQDFFGEEWSRKISNKSSHVKQTPNDENVSKPTTQMDQQETNPMFRSNSGSFRYMRFKMGSSKRGWRSRSVSVMGSKSKSRWQVFMFGFGSGRFPEKMDLMDIKSRQLRSRSATTTVSRDGDHGGGEGGGGRRTGKKVWWRLVDVLGCGGGYERSKMVVV